MSTVKELVKRHPVLTYAPISENVMFSCTTILEVRKDSLTH
jgi:hypothetical protein